MVVTRVSAGMSYSNSRRHMSSVGSSKFSGRSHIGDRIGIVLPVYYLRSTEHLRFLFYIQIRIHVDP